jgi:hypothetical protein
MFHKPRIPLAVTINNHHNMLRHLLRSASANCRSQLLFKPLGAFAKEAPKKDGPKKEEAPAPVAEESV